MPFRFQHNRDVQCADHSRRTNFDVDSVIEIPINIDDVISRRLDRERWFDIARTIRRDDSRPDGINHNYFSCRGCVRASVVWRNTVEDYCNRHNIELIDDVQDLLSYSDDETSEIPQHTENVQTSRFSSEPLSITLHLSVESTNELLQQIAGHLGNESISRNNQQPPAVEHAPLSVTLGDGQTRIAHRFAADTFADVIAILGLNRISEILPGIVSTISRPREGKKRGRYYVYTNNTTVEKKRILEEVARHLFVDLIVEVQSEVTTDESSSN